MPVPASRIQLNLHFEPGADPVRGLVEDAHGHQHAFWGWLELMETVKRLSEDVSSTSPSRQPYSRAERADASAKKPRKHIREPRPKESG